jgi:hypothetical protein
MPIPFGPAVVEGTALDTRTTLIIKNLPAHYTSAALGHLLDSLGLRGCFNFVYVPVNYKSLTAFGYGTVDMASHNAALTLARSLQGFQGLDQARQPLEVDWSDRQGLQQQIVRYRDSPLMHSSVSEDLKPMLFRDGRRIPFPEPTKKIQPPSHRPTRVQNGQNSRRGRITR